MEEELDIKELFIAIWNKKLFIILITVIFALIGIIKYDVLGFKAKKDSLVDNKTLYTVGTSFIIGDSTKIVKTTTETLNDNGQVVNLNEISTISEKIKVDANMVITYEELIRKEENMEFLLKEFDIEMKLEELQKLCYLRNVPNSNILKVYVKYTDKEIAKKMANLLREMLEKDVKQLYNIENISLINSAEVLNDNEIENIEINNNNTTNTTKNLSKVEKSPKEKMIILVFLGFFLSCGGVVILEIFNNSVKNEESLEKATKLKTLANIPNSTLDNKEYFRLLRVNINECKTILITSPETKDGKTYVATNLSKSFSDLGKKVLLLDLMNENNHLVENYNGNGLTDFLSSDEKIIEKYIGKTKLSNLDVLSIGKNLSNITELLESSKMIETLKTLERLYDVIIIDSENVLESANTLAIAKISKFSILVVKQRKTNLKNVIKAKNNIEDVGGNVIGNVIYKKA